MGSTHTLIPKSILPKSHNSTALSNCTKFSHNSQNDFDNHFDTQSKYLSTNTTNKLSDNYKITQNPTNSLKSTENITPIPIQIPTFIPNFSPYLPLKYVSTTTHFISIASSPQSSTILRNHTSSPNSSHPYPKFTQK